MRPDLSRLLNCDLNCDLGELTGPANQDAALMPLISSANIACGAHAGDNDTMRRTVDLALAHRVAIGAHPGYADPEHFGRRPMQLAPDALEDLLLSQIARLDAIVRASGGQLHHVKPHGALYNQASADPALAAQIAAAVRAFNPSLVLVGAAGGALIAAGLEAGLSVAREGFADRRYQADGLLVPRSHPRALLESDREALQQARTLLRGDAIQSLEGPPIRLTIDTLCLHGDGPHALTFARRIRHWLDSIGVRPLPPGRGTNRE